LACLPEGYELLSGRDFFNKVLVKEKTGRIGNFALPSEFDYDLEALKEGASKFKVEPVQYDEEGDLDLDDIEDEDEL
jgi:hypothetical protein